MTLAEQRLIEGYTKLWKDFGDEEARFAALRLRGRLGVWKGFAFSFVGMDGTRVWSYLKSLDNLFDIARHLPRRYVDGKVLPVFSPTPPGTTGSCYLDGVYSWDSTRLMVNDGEGFKLMERTDKHRGGR